MAAAPIHLRACAMDKPSASVPSDLVRFYICQGPGAPRRATTAVGDLMIAADGAPSSDLLIVWIILEIFFALFVAIGVYPVMRLVGQTPAAALATAGGAFVASLTLTLVITSMLLKP